MLEPRVVENTKMDLNNMITIFTPSFIRNDSLDIQECLFNKSKEENFMKQMIDYVKNNKLTKGTLNNNSDRISLRFNHAINTKYYKK